MWLCCLGCVYTGSELWTCFFHLAPPAKLKYQQSRMGTPPPPLLWPRPDPGHPTPARQALWNIEFTFECDQCLSIDPTCTGIKHRCALINPFIPEFCHLHPLQAANCCRNSRLVVDKDDLKCGWKIQKNCHVLVNQFYGNFHSRTPSCRKISLMSADFKTLWKVEFCIANEKYCNAKAKPVTAHFTSKEFAIAQQNTT